MKGSELFLWYLVFGPMIVSVLLSRFVCSRLGIRGFKEVQVGRVGDWPITEYRYSCSHFVVFGVLTAALWAGLIALSLWVARAIDSDLVKNLGR